VEIRAGLAGESAAAAASIEVAEDGDEVWDEVDGAEGVGEGDEGDSFGVPGDAGPRAAK